MTPCCSRRPYRPVLVPLPVAMHVLGLEAASIYEMVEDGELRWVWDVASAPPRRQLRFWMGELLWPDKNDQELEDVIQKVIGHPFEKKFHARTVCNLLFIARPHLLRLSVTGDLPARKESHVLWVTRADLEKFLRSRLAT